MHAALLIEGRDGLGSRDFASGRPDGAIRHGGVHDAKQAFHQIAAIIHFRHDSVGAVPAISRNDSSPPAIRREPAGKVLQDVSMSVPLFARNDDPGLVGIVLDTELGEDVRRNIDLWTG